MFITNNNIIITSKGSSLAINSDSILTTYGIDQFIVEKKQSETIIVNTQILPSFYLGINNEVFIGQLSKNDDTAIITNKLKFVKDLRINDYLVIPKVHLSSEENINKTMCWLYANYIVSGYITIDWKTNEEIIIIKPKRMSNKESIKLKSIKDVTFNTNKKIIFIKNKELISFLKKYSDNIPLSLYSAENSIVSYFYHVLNIESIYGTTKSKTLILDLFLLAYSKLDRVYKIKEIKRISEHNKNKKIYKLSSSDSNDYIVADGKLYLKITNIINGKIMFGLNLENNDKNKHIHIGFCMLV